MDQHGAFLLEQKDLTPQSLHAILQEVLQSPQKLQVMKQNLEKFDFSNSTQVIAQSLLKEINV